MSNKTECQFCKKQFTSTAGKNGHQPYCKSNPNKIPPWNKGRTKETCPIVKAVGDKIRKTQNDPEWLATTGKGKKEKITQAKLGLIPWNKGLTKETSPILKETGLKIAKALNSAPRHIKEKRRRAQRKVTLERITKHPFARFHNTKPEQEMKKFLEKLGIKYIQNYPVWKIKHAYPADFFLPDYNIIIEVDGTHWHNFPLGTHKDEIRTKELERAGYWVFRIWDDLLPVLDTDDMTFVFMEFLENTGQKMTRTKRRCPDCKARILKEVG